MSDIIYQTIQILNDFKLNFDFCLEYQMAMKPLMIVILVSIHLVHLERIKLEIFFSPIP